MLPLDTMQATETWNAATDRPDGPEGANLPVEITEELHEALSVASGRHLIMPNCFTDDVPEGYQRVSPAEAGAGGKIVHLEPLDPTHSGAIAVGPGAGSTERSFAGDLAKVMRPGFAYGVVGMVPTAQVALLAVYKRVASIN